MPRAKTTMACVGDTYAVRLRSRAWGLCRIVWTRPEWKHTSVVGLDWFGKEPPDAGVAREAPLLQMTHPDSANPCWVRILRRLNVPDSCSLVAHVAPRPEELALPLGDDWKDVGDLHRSSSWKAVAHTLDREFRFRTKPAYRDELAKKPRGGDVYAIPRDGRWGVLRVLGVVVRIEEDRFATRCYVVGGRAVFDRCPTADEARATLDDVSRAIECTSPPPRDMVLLGNWPARFEIEDPTRGRALADWALLRP